MCVCVLDGVSKLHTNMFKKAVLSLVTHSHGRLIHKHKRLQETQHPIMDFNHTRRVRKKG